MVTVKEMEADAAGRALMGALKDPKRPVTIADASTASGLPLRDAERGLHWLVAEYRGHLRVTEKGELLFVFPNAFTKPWVVKNALARAADRVGHVLAGMLRFLVRAWLAIVLVGYVAIFVAVLIGLMFASANSNDRDRGRGGDRIFGGFALVLRIVADAFFWTFHPFSPFAYSYGPSFGARAPAREVRKKDETPFYEKVNRYFFGPPKPPADPRAHEKAILAEIRRQKGRIGLADVMRVTGLPRDVADPMMARLMVDYDGDVAVSEDGGILYRFESIRRTADAHAVEVIDPKRAPGEAWAEPPKLPPLTGNPGNTNFLITALNLFNLMMGAYAITAGLTVNRLFTAIAYHVPLARIPFDGTPIVLGVIPVVFSLLLLVVPLARAALRPRQEKKAARERGRLAVVRAVIERVRAKQPVSEAALADAYRRATGEEAESKAITRYVVALGGDVDDRAVAAGQIRYRFADLETEAAALEEERAQAADEEAEVGKVELASDS